jgi:hypothetical protein
MLGLNLTSSCFFHIFLVYLHVEKITKKEYNKQYWVANPEKAKEQRKKDNAKYRAKNKQKLLAMNKEYLVEYRKNNKIKINDYNKKYNSNRRKTDTFYKFKCNIRNLIGNSIKSKGYTKNSQVYQIIGCTLEELFIHLEVKFENWMNWNNYGNPADNILEINKTWDIDHIIPITNAKTEEELIKLNHYTNLQPLCSFINRKVKRDKVIITTTLSP